MTIIKKILLATDFSDTSQKAMNYAKEMANKLEANLEVVFVSDPSALDCGVTHFSISGITTWAEKYKKEKDEVENKLKSLDTSGKKFVLEGPPGKTIVKYLQDNKDYDLVMIGSHGYGALDRFVLGSVSEYVSRYAPCPVMIIKKEIS